MLLHICGSLEDNSVEGMSSLPFFFYMHSGSGVLGFELRSFRLAQQPLPTELSCWP